MTTFSMICYLALVDCHGVGWLQSSPDYLEKKQYVFGRDEAAYAALDRSNQQRILAYCKKWNVPLPDPVKVYEKDLWETIPF